MPPWLAFLCGLCLGGLAIFVVAIITSCREPGEPFIMAKGPHDIHMRPKGPPTSPRERSHDNHNER